MNDIFEWILEHLLSAVQWLFYNVFDSCYAFIKILYGCIKNFLLGGKMSEIGINFFGHLADSFDGAQLSFNCVYVLVGFSIFFFITKHLVIPLIVAFINAIVDAITPLT